MSTIELSWRDRVIGGAQTPRRFLDFIIDGRSLYDQFGDLITPLGWLSPTENQNAVNRLLLIDEADLPNNRRSLYVCPECADLGCGTVSVVIERIGEKVVWRDFGYENNYDDNVYLDDFADVGPFTFDEREYHNAINSVSDWQ